MPPPSHLIYIPLALGIGAYLGWFLGARSVRKAWDAEIKRARRAADRESAEAAPGSGAP